MNDSDMSYMIASAMRAMIGIITPHMRMICLDWTADTLWVKAYFDHEPTVDEKEEIADMTSEIISDFSSINDVKEECIYTRLPLHELDRMRATIYERNEIMYTPEGRLKPEYS